MPPFLRTHKGCTQVEYQFMCTPGLGSTSCSMYCTTQRVYRNGVSVYICTLWGNGILSTPECYTEIFFFEKGVIPSKILLFVVVHFRIVLNWNVSCDEKQDKKMFHGETSLLGLFERVNFKF